MVWNGLAFRMLCLAAPLLFPYLAVVLTALFVEKNINLVTDCSPNSLLMLNAGSLFHQLSDQGIHVIVAAGNSNNDASHTSPACARGAFTVGATNINDACAYFSNYGPVIDLFAPDQNIISTGIESNIATCVMSGTSMVCK